MAEKCVLLLMLTCFTRFDLKTGFIPARWLGIAGIVGVCIRLWKGGFSGENLPAGVSVGIFLLLISFLSKGAVGSADGWMLCISGLLLDFQENLFLLMGACVLASVYAVALLALKRGKRQTEFPFFPFLLAAYLALLLLL